MTTIHLAYPFHDVRSGTAVLAAALTLFDADDPVELVLSAAEGMPGEAAVAELGDLWGELIARLGQAPRMRVVEAVEAATLQVFARIVVTGDPIGDATAVLMLGSVGRNLGSAYGGSGWLRGRTDLIRLELDAAARRRQQRSGRAPCDPVRIVVMLQHIQVWSAVDSIVRAARDSAEVRLDVVLMPDASGSFQQHPREEVAAYVAERGVPLRDPEWLRGRLTELDVLIVPDPYLARWNTPPGLSPQEVAEAGVRLVLAPYAQALSGDPVNLRLMHDHPFHRLAWRLFAPSEGAVANYARHGGAGTAHVRYLGSVKRERLLADQEAAVQARDVRARLGTERVVLWNPHFVGDRALSTFQELAEPILGYAASHPELGLLVRPHPRLVPEYLFSGLLEHVADFRARCERLPNVMLDESMDATVAMLAADAMVSDLSSLIAEYHVLERPIALLRPSPDLAFNEDRTWLDGTTIIDAVPGLTDFLDRVRPAPQAPRGALPDLGAGARIVETIVRDYRAELAGASAD
ncbi:CDP-glycerol glycerophosphotransferase family protein [Nocardioides sp. BP30]|uniref:CDP-glycerol glycerophosphotransferase family protein n=1 Tax=Nocardioides sp. BP30 TaxID=3036374 RepID=UPI0024690FD2|nr:CDP-glycerol glycerophosphotransferase family protein [Nocardioides sp. BP30]WGL53680.1 CDP-glycerol glycerophosphotransferase family protein [Nocardioides sp. BP30]